LFSTRRRQTTLQRAWRSYVCSSALPAPVTANPLYTVRVGPVSNRDRASAIAKQLAAGGFSPTINTQTGPVFRVVSEPLPRSVAEHRKSVVEGKGGGRGERQAWERDR